MKKSQARRSGLWRGLRLVLAKIVGFFKANTHSILLCFVGHAELPSIPHKLQT